MTFDPPAEGRSPWIARAPNDDAQHPALREDLDVDVAVVGAGMVGLTTALMLRRSGARVAVLEGRRVAAAASGNNTAKVTALHGLAYSKLAGAGREASARYARANQEGLELIGRLVEEFEIECRWRRTANYTYAERRDGRERIEREVEASRAAGLETEFVEATPLPFAVAGAVKLADQAEFDPVAYLRGLAGQLGGDGQGVFEDTRVVDVSRDAVRTEDGAIVRAGHVVLATHLPIADQVGVFARAAPMASFAIAATLDRPLEGMYIDVEGEHSLRGLRLGDQELAIVAGRGHRLGTASAAESLAALRRYGRDRLGASELRHHWDAHDFVTEDHLPFVGSIGLRSDRVLTATGLNKWGLALGAACGRMLAETIGSGERAWPDEFDSRRLPRPRSWPRLAANGIATGRHLALDRLRRGSADELAPGEGKVIGRGVEQHAAYRDEAGRLHELAARCTHMGCIVAFNGPAKTWDCPCHGSRFALDGSVLEGPATAPLERKDA
jgi:glycine/D-amino acid oxidase-like deaminating enzyme/nitrite reductase/ring-hydroxylating ferredoxin subunit